MKNSLKKTLSTLLFLALLSACAVKTSEPSNVPDLQETQAVNGQAGYQANAILNTDLIFTIKSNEIFDGNAVMAFSEALQEGKLQFTANDISYHYEPLGQDSYRIYRLTPVAESLLGRVEPVNGGILSNELLAAIETALAKETRIFEHLGTTYVLSENRKAVQISTIADAAIANEYYLEAYDPTYNEMIRAYDFMLNLEIALQQQERTFSYESDSFGVLAVSGGYSISDSQSNLFAELSNIYVIPRSNNTAIPLGFKNLVRDAIVNQKEGFTYSDSLGAETNYQVEKLENSWSVDPIK
ncbi:MAG TPA: hypothetical protein DD636_06050 [Anaerolineaceae bacterium]|jgi:hypothetical protein|nr:hypothetical protein [Anaerolineaceae bacterium]